MSKKNICLETLLELNTMAIYEDVAKN